MAYASLRLRVVVLGLLVVASSAAYLTTGAPRASAVDPQMFYLNIDVQQVIAEAEDLYAFDAPWPPPAGYPDFYLKMIVRDIGGDATKTTPTVSNSGVFPAPDSWDFSVLAAVTDPTQPVQILIGMWESDSPDPDDVVDISPWAGDGKFDNEGWKDGTYFVFDYYVYRPGALSDHVYRPNWDSELAYAEGTPYLLGGNADGSVGAGGLDAFLLISISDSGSFTEDTTPPSSQVNELPAAVANPSFPVSWSGTDDKSGIYTYDVQVRLWVGGVVRWTDWQKGTSATGATYDGGEGISYCFRSRARDNVGNLEDWPPAPPPPIPYYGDTCTQVDHVGPITVSGWPSSETVSEGGNMTFGAVVLDAASHSIASFATISWSVSPASCGVFTPATGSTTKFTASSTAGGLECTVEARAVYKSWSNTWSKALETTHAGPLRARVSPTPMSVPEGASSKFVTEVLDLGGDNLTSQATIRWSLAPTACGSITPSEGSVATFTAGTVAGGLECTVSVNSTWGGWWDNRTVEFDVVHAGPLTVTINAETSPLAEDASRSFAATVKDLGGQDVGPLASFAWSVTPASCGAFSSSAKAATEFKASRTAGVTTCTIKASAAFGAWSNDASIGLSIVHAGPLTASVTPESLTVTQSESQILRVVVTDSGGQDITSLATITWSLSPSDCGSLSAASGASVTFTAGATAGGKSCQASAAVTYAGLSTSGTLVIAVSQPVGPAGGDAAPFILIAAVVGIAAIVGVSVILLRRTKRPKE